MVYEGMGAVNLLSRAAVTAPGYVDTKAAQQKRSAALLATAATSKQPGGVFVPTSTASTGPAEDSGGVPTAVFVAGGAVALLALAAVAYKVKKSKKKK